MPSRRDAIRLLAGSALAAAAPLGRGAEGGVEPAVSDDGLYTQPWFMQTFLEMRDDLAEAAGQGKRFAVLWEQKGCPYCREMHRVNFARPEINAYVRERFGIVQLNMWGSREVTDFDGNAMEERELARRWRVTFTPTIQFFPPSLADAGGKTGAAIEVARMPGYFKPFHFVSMFEFVYENAYADQHFQRYLQQKFADLKAKGIDPNVW